MRWFLAGALALLLGLGFWRLASQPQQPGLSAYRLRPFAAEEEPEMFPAWAPDGRSLAYSAQHGAEYALMVKSLDGSPPAVVARAAAPAVALGIFSISWAPDGNRLYYIAGVGATFGHITSVARAGGEPQGVVDGLADAAMLSPDGKTLAALMREDEDGQDQRVLTLTSPPGSSPRRLKTIAGFSHQSRLAWSPDGSKLLVFSQEPRFWVVDVRTGETKESAEPSREPTYFNLCWLDNRRAVVSWTDSRDAAGAQTNLWSLDTETGRMTLLLPSTEPLSDPALSPDAKSLAFRSGILDFDLMELPLDGGAARPLRATRHWENSPDWSPVRPEFVYVTPEGLRLRSEDGSRDEFLVTLASFPGASEIVSPSFSPDGSQVAYTVKNSKDDGQVWVSPVSGGLPSPLGGTKGMYGIAWSPDGKWMAFNWAERQWPPSKLAKIRIGSIDPPMVLSDQACEFAPSWSPDGRQILCSRNSQLHVISADGGPPQVLSQDFEPVGAWSREMRYIYAIRKTDGKRQLGKLDWESGGFQPAVDVPLDWLINTSELGQVRLSLAPDGKSLATTVVRQTGDIWILEGFERPPSLWQRLWQ